MTRYDFRVRRQLFQRKGAERFQNFEALEKRYKSRRRMAVIGRSLLILIALVILLGVLVFTSKANNLPPAKSQQFRSELVKAHPKGRL